MEAHRVAVIGAGSWGTALSVLLAKKGYEVRLWVRKREAYERICRGRENIHYLPGVILPERIIPQMDIQYTISDIDIIVLAVPSHLVRRISHDIAPYLSSGAVVVNAAKGLENKSFLRLSQVIEEEIPYARVAVLSGPSHAEEVSRDIPTTVVVSGKSHELAEYVQEIFMTPKFRVYTNDDLIGVEMGGALKNIIALGAGISDGLGFGDNTKAALMTRGIVEITRLGQAMGANPLTFAGLSGIGDLIVTCTSIHSRNRKAGMDIAQGKKLEQVLHEIGMVVEGVRTCEAAYYLAKSLELEMPITNEIYQVLYEKKDPKEAVMDLMLRNRTNESEVTAFDIGFDMHR